MFKTSKEAISSLKQVLCPIYCGFRKTKVLIYAPDAKAAELDAFAGEIAPLDGAWFVGVIAQNRRYTMSRKIAYAITAVNLLFQLVYMTLGQFTPGELGALQYIFHLFRAEYMIVSGLLSLAALCILAVCLIRARGQGWKRDGLAMLLNAEYIAYWLSLMRMQ